MPQVSIIIPTYNRADLVGHAIESVLEQTYADWELIVVDDGSEDDTRDVVARYTDPRIQYIYQENRKLPGARNTGIRASTGEYVAFLDSDDRFLPDKLEAQVASIADRADVGLVASGWTEVDGQLNPLRTICPWRLNVKLSLDSWLYGCPFIVPVILVRRHWLQQVGLFDEKQHYVEDWDLWLRLAYAGCQMEWAPATVCLRTIHDSNMVRNAAAMSEGIFRLFEKFFAQPGLPPDILSQKDQVHANAHLDGAVRAFAAGTLNAGQAHLASAVRLDAGLAEGEYPLVLQALASTALTHQARDLETYVDGVCDALNEILPQLARSRRQMYAAISATRAFDHFAHGRRWQARLGAARALLMHPWWFRNRGLLSIMLKP